MLWTLFVILLVLWLVGVVSSYTLGGFIHLLLVLALVALVFQLGRERRRRESVPPCPSVSPITEERAAGQGEFTRAHRPVQ